MPLRRLCCRSSKLFRTIAPVSAFIPPSRLLLFLTLTLFINATLVSSKLSDKQLKDLEKIKLEPQQLLKTEKLHYTWYLTATNALLGAVARELYLRMDRKNRREFIKCLQRIKKDLDIQAGARCITAALDNRLIRKKSFHDNAENFSIFGKNYGGYSTVSESFVQEEGNAGDSDESGSFQQEPNEFRRIFNWKLKKQKNFGKRLRKRHNALRIDGQNKELIDESIKLAKHDQDQDLKIIRMNQAPGLIDPKEEFMNMASSPIWTTSKLLTNLFRALDSKTQAKQKSWKEMYKKLEKVQDMIESSSENAKYRNRLLDVVLQNNNFNRQRRTLTERVQGYLPASMQKSPLMGKLFNILDSFAKHNGDDNFKILSPRFLPVIPDKKKIRHALSPNLFPMYNDDSPNSILPIPKMLKATGMSDSDRDAVIELIMQASGARNMIDKTIESMDRIEKFGLADDITNITVFIRNMFTKLEKTFNSRQKREIKSRHYTFLTKEQLLSLFGPEGPYNNTKFPFSIEEYGTWSEEDKKNALFNRIRALAGETVDDPARGSRRKRQVTLSPFAFSPSVLGVSVLAPVTLSPNIFSPSILNPYILSPPVLSPQIADPMIISPYILGPNTLSAAIMNVYVLTPYVLSPNVMNPYIMSPLILSPYILSPDLLSPTILCGGIISPAVMSPSVLSPSAFAADILSPSILS